MVLRETMAACEIVSKLDMCQRWNISTIHIFC